MGVNYNEIFKNIKSLCIKTLMAVEPEIILSMRQAKKSESTGNKCFEIYGFDVMMDSNLKPWLLEVNVMPSLSSSSPYDKMVKTTLLSDTLHLVGYNVFDRIKIDEERKQDKKNPTGLAPVTKEKK
jgi:tubulin polyglutamylase TTLL4